RVLLSCIVPPTSVISHLSLHDALPIYLRLDRRRHSVALMPEDLDRPRARRREAENQLEQGRLARAVLAEHADDVAGVDLERDVRDRKSTRLNSSHEKISYAVFCLKKKK